MANFFSGYLAQGTGAGVSFVENVTSGYTRQALSLAALSYGQTGLNAGVTFPGLSAAYTVTQRALYDSATGGNLIMYWALRSPVSIPAYGTDTLASGSFSLLFPDLVTFNGSTALQWTAGTVIGSTSFSTPVVAGVALAYTGGSMEASSSAGLGGGAGGSGTPTASSTFSPALVIGGGPSGATYTAQNGRYIQSGALTSFNLEVEWSTIGAANGAITITGLPAAVSGGCGQLVVAGYGVTASGPVYGVVNTSGTLTLLVGGSGSADSTLNTSNLAAAGGFLVSGSYFTA